MYIHATYTINQVHVEYKKGENLKKNTQRKPPKHSKTKQTKNTHAHIPQMLNVKN